MRVLEDLETCADSPDRRRFLLLTSSLLVDRIYVHTELARTLSNAGEVTVWATSKSDEAAGAVWNGVPMNVEPFPEVRPFREFPYNYLRRLNEYAWDYRQRIPSRLSMMRHVRDKNLSRSVKVLKLPARVIAATRLERVLERGLEKLLLSYRRSEEAERRLRELRPSVVVATGPFQFEQPAIVAAARRLHIPVIAYIPSWDNITTKHRMVFDYDAYIVWTREAREELRQYYPSTRRRPVYAVGAPQFDIFFDERFLQPRSDFFGEQGLDPSRKLIVYALGSPNFLQEHHGAIAFAERVLRGELGDVQLLVRPHPIHDRGRLGAEFARFGPNVRLQQQPHADKDLTAKTQDERQVVEWINTFRHADVVVNLSSTVTVDAAIFDRPVVNLDFDPQPGARDQALIRDVNHAWNHFKPVAESGGVALASNMDEVVGAVRRYLDDPTLDAIERRWIAEHVCGRLDGRSASRMARAICDFAALAPFGGHRENHDRNVGHRRKARA